MLGIAASLQKGGASLLTFVKDNLKLYLDFKSNKSDTLKFPCDGSTYFSGSNQYIEIADNNDLDIAQGESFTFACWLKVEDTGANELIFSKRHSDIGYSITWHSSEKPVFYIRDSAGNNYYSYTSDALSYNTWYHYAVVWNPSTMKATHYVNGIDAGRSFENDATLVDASNSGVARIGIPADSTSYDFKGYLANMGIWKRTLSAEEINSVMRKNYSQLGSVEKTCLVAWWALDNAVLGDELIADGDFSSSDNWTESSGWTIDTTQGKAIYVPDGTNSYRTMPYTNATLNTSAEYEVTITIDSCSNLANCGIIVGGAVRNFSPSHVTSTGTTTFSVVIGRADLQLWSQNASITISNISVKEKNVHTDSKGSNNGVNVGATTTTSVYGGNAPILPRAVDVAKEGQADNIGNGSALLNGSSDYVQVEDSNVLDAPASWTLSAWINLGSGTSGFDRIVGKQTTAGQCNYGIGLKNGTDFGVFINDGNGFNDLYHATDLTVGEWVHGVGTWDGSYLKVYLNGILVETSSDLSSSNASVVNTAPLLIGRNATDGNQYFGGNLSQVGVWQGALTAEQVRTLAQDVTSYAKIPADVKSTLGADFFTDSTFDLSGTQSASTTGTHWTTGSAWTIANGEAIYDGTAHENRLELPSATLQSAGLYKFSFTISDANTKGAFKIKADGNDIIATNYYDNGDHVIYYNQSGAYGSAKTIKIEARNDVHGAFKLQSASWKLVTNDLVAYYPLDADSSNTSSVAKITNDSVNGETLSGEKLGTWANSDFPWTTLTSSGTTISSAISNGSATMIAVNPFSSVSGSLYKITFNLTLNSGTVPSFSIREGATGSIGDGSGDFGTVSSGLNTHYFQASSTKTLYMFFNVNSVASNFSLSDVSIKEVTSNTGVLK